jgi:enamine deaminase RidA (YjgF/YER057c/UK114 family)
MSYEKKFMSLVGNLPEPTVPPGCNFALFREVGKLLIISGYGPFWGSTIPAIYLGKLSKDVSVATATEAAQLTTKNLLLIARQAITSLDKVDKIVSVEGFVNSTSDFTDQPSVMNGCSDFLVQVFGTNGTHTRSAIGTNTLAFNICVEISLTLLVK